MAVTSGMYFKSTADLMSFDGVGYTKQLRKALRVLFKEAARKWLIEINSRIPWRTGFLLGAFRPLEDALNVSVMNKGRTFAGPNTKTALRKSKTGPERYKQLQALRAQEAKWKKQLEEAEGRFKAEFPHGIKKRNRKELDKLKEERDLRTKRGKSKIGDKQRSLSTDEDRAAAEGLSLRQNIDQEMYEAAKTGKEKAANKLLRRLRFQQGQAQQRMLNKMKLRYKYLQMKLKKRESALTRIKKAKQRKRTSSTGIAPEQAKVLDILAQMREVVAKQNGIDYNPKGNRRDVTGAFTNRYKKKTVKKYKKYKTIETRVVEEPNPDYPKTQKEKLALIRAKKLPPATIKREIQIETIKRKLVGTKVVKRKIRDNLRKNHKEYFREYYYHTKGSKARVLKTPKSGQAYAIDRSTIFTEDLAKSGTAKYQTGFDTPGELPMAAKGVKNLTPDAMLKTAQAREAGSKANITFSYSVDIRYWRIMDLFKGRKGSPWMSLKEANRAFIDHVQANISKVLPPITQYLIVSKSTVVSPKATLKGLT